MYCVIYTYVIYTYIFVIIAFAKIIIDKNTIISANNL